MKNFSNTIYFEDEVDWAATRWVLCDGKGCHNRIRLDQDNYTEFKTGECLCEVCGQDRDTLLALFEGKDVINWY